MDTDSRHIVTTALALRASHPKAPALDILDEAMSGRHDTDPQFDDAAVDDHTLPTAPFGLLLRDAFAPQLAVPELPEGMESMPEDFGCQWQLHVIEPFANRYGLWSAEGDRARWRQACSTQIRQRWPMVDPEQAEEWSRQLDQAYERRVIDPKDAADGFVRNAEEQGAQPAPSAARLALYPDKLA